MATTQEPTIRQLVRTEKPLVLPGAHDALWALLIKQAGFKSFFIGGIQTAGARYGLPDIGLAQLGEFAAAIRDIVGTGTPFEEYTEIVGIERWRDIERRFRPKK